SLAARFRIEHEAAQNAVGAELRHSMAAGDVLIAMKEQVGHGEFQKCCTTYFSSVASRTLRQYMQLAAARATIEAKWHHDATLSVRDALRLIRFGSSKKSEPRKSALPSGQAFNQANLQDRQTFSADVDLSKLLEALSPRKRAELQR